uniref:Uncharacterized protein n=1 Tax=Romanomermis culicivorax TaxID=13658 RepID=A0A915KHJ5_ROMCU
MSHMMQSIDQYAKTIASNYYRLGTVLPLGGASHGFHFEKWWQCWDGSNVGTAAMFGQWQCWDGGNVGMVAMLGFFGGNVGMVAFLVTVAMLGWWQSWDYT